MSRTISIINAGNIYARNFLKTVQGFDKVICGDIFNSRKSFLSTLNTLRAQDNSIQLSHMNTNSPLLLEQAIKPAQVVVYFSHDYYSMVEENNKNIEMTAAYNVEKLLFVNPIEFTNYFMGTGIVDNPLKEEEQSQDKAKEIFEKATFLRSNLVFGVNSYIIRFLIQSWMEGYSYFDESELRHFRFHPIHYEDLTTLIQYIITEETNIFEGKKYQARGSESLSFVDINNLIKQFYEVESKHAQPNKVLKNFYKRWQLFFHGNTHITNMEFMLKFLQFNNPKFENYANLADEIKFKTKSLRESYVSQKQNKEQHTKEELEALRYPIMQDYWRRSLN